ncbi:S-methyl-5-thioribose kinase [Streptomyces cinerochromogenes]|uniref:S-methyl-5-thioribose kinase n=1 Tax=Streptomyces cinerochromogenes TaxID=66422 RepID=UPI001670798A|nr:S-methyl-5-thioribose kinase [Streptomyces cinerochromogenes]GGS56341.1 methylthioribose kinase [Streptomyces cinerochromogenes]
MTASVPVVEPDITKLLDHLSRQPALADRLGGTRDLWSAREIGDGNVNHVFVVRGPAGAVCVKHAPPYVRAAGPSWFLTPRRILFEHRALVEHRRHAGPHVPEPLHVDPEEHLLTVEYLAGHSVLRGGLAAGASYPHFAEQAAHYLAHTLFFTSDLALPAGRKRELTSLFETNTAMCQIMEDMVFTEIFLPHRRNRWTSPELDEDVRRLQRDTDLKLAVCRLKQRYLTSRDALLHGDLHTGSIMISDHSLSVIDQEFACYGPMGFDVGTLLAHLLIAYFAAGARGPDQAAQQDWLLSAVEEVWDGFRTRFTELWRDQADGDGYPAALFTGAATAALEAERQRYMGALFTDSLGFCGAEIIRRIVGFARPADFTTITDSAKRAAAERRALTLARALTTTPTDYHSVTDLTAAARDSY